MKEYRVRAYFRDDAPRGYEPRSYKRKVTNDPHEAEIMLKEAKEYYSKYAYLDKVVLESREVGRWEKQ